MDFDVFLCHNSQDKPEVIEIGLKLQEQGLNPWLDEWELQPGLPWQQELERQIQNIKSAAVFVGGSGVGPWQQMEIEAYLRRFVNQHCPVIPVLLPNTPKQPELPLFLEGMTWVDFRRSHPEPMGRLIWGITGIKPQPVVNVEPSKTSIINKQKIIPLPNKPPPSNEIELKSERGVDYTKLRDLLAAGKWKEADQETGKVMCQAVGRESARWLDIEDIDNFPCEDLRTINQLWLHYSKGKFGFSVQKEIYESLGGTREYNEEVWKKFGDRVGWRKGGSWLSYSGLTFNLELAPQAHLPVCWIGEGRGRYEEEDWYRWVGGFGLWRFWGGISSFAQRLVSCNI